MICEAREETSNRVFGGGESGSKGESEFLIASGTNGQRLPSPSAAGAR